MRRRIPSALWVAALLTTVVLAAAACGKKKAPIARPTTPLAPVASTVPDRPPTPPEALGDANIVPPEPVSRLVSTMTLAPSAMACSAGATWQPGHAIPPATAAGPSQHAQESDWPVSL